MCETIDIELSYLNRLYHKPKYLMMFTKFLETLYINKYGMRSYGQANHSIDCISYNIMDSWYSGCNGMSVTRDRNKYTAYVIINGRYIKTGVGHKGIINCLDLLEEQGYIITTKGYYVNEKVRQNGFVQFTQKLLDVLDNSINKNKIRKMKKMNVLVLRDNQGEYQEFKLNKERKSMLEVLNRYNQMLLDHEILLDGKPIKTQFHRSFCRGQFEYGGRFYSGSEGFNVQGINKTQRSTFVFDGEETVELDFKCLHCALLYEKKGIVLDEDFDVYGNPNQHYSGINLETYNIRKQYDHKHNPVRSLFKVAMLIMLNAKDEKEAFGALSLKIKEDMKRCIKDQLFAGVDTFDIDYVFELLAEHNEGISEYFFKDSGVTLQRIDSDIMNIILEYCAINDIVVLPVHDSVICPASKMSEITAIMKKAYKDVLGSDSNCRIEV